MRWVPTSLFVVSTMELILTPSDPVYSRAEPCSVFLHHPLTFWHYMRQYSAAIHRVFMPVFFWKHWKWVARSFFLVCLSLEALLKPVHHVWPCWYFKYEWHGFQHHSNMQLPRYDNWQTAGVVPWRGKELRSQQWLCQFLTTKPPGN